MADINVKQGEARTITFTVKDDDGNLINMTGATVTFGVKRTYTESEFLLTKNDGDFDKSQAVQGKLSVDLQEDDTNLLPGIYVADVKLVFSVTNIVKSTTFSFQVKPAIT